MCAFRCSSFALSILCTGGVTKDPVLQPSRQNGSSVCPAGTDRDGYDSSPVDAVAMTGVGGICSGGDKRQCTPGDFDGSGIGCAECPYPARCPDVGNCSTGATGNLCGACADGYYNLIGRCVKCSSSGLWTGFLALLGLGAAMAAFWKISAQEKQSMMTCTKQQRPVQLPKKSESWGPKKRQNRARQQRPPEHRIMTPWGQVFARWWLLSPGRISRSRSCRSCYRMSTFLTPSKRPPNGSETLCSSTLDLRQSLSALPHRHPAWRRN